MQRVFINYRTEDTGSTASRLFESLNRILIDGQVFIDHERITGGAIWPKRLEAELAEATAMVCLIGKRWLTIQDSETGERLLSNPEDWVRREIEGALARDILIIPVLVDDAVTPPERAYQALQSLAGLRDRQFRPLRRTEWDVDVGKLCALLKERGFESRKETDALYESARERAHIHADAINRYRERLSGLYDRWDLSNVGVAQAGTSKPIEVPLDDIYLPLRLAEVKNAAQEGAGFTYSPLALLARDRPLVVRGAGGTGKTTWVRWTFRRLLRDPGAFPISVELRRLAAGWGKPLSPNENRTLEGYVEGLLAEYAGSEWREILREVLVSENSPRPLLFVDGWDELGPLGEELRFKLVRFQKDYPRVLVVVTSRPYGQGRPSHAEGFEVLDIQPLSGEEISIFASRFYDRCWGEDQKAASEYCHRFLRTLDRSPETLSLARTVLLLTMMLFISRVKQLPDKRHLLYQTCVEHLLTALPERRQEEGVLILGDQWRPRDSEETLRVTALLAFRVQSSHYEDRSSIVLSRDEMKQLLPEPWRDEQRARFLNWLTASAGLLVDRSDEMLSFAHLSFQEYLAAWHLYATVEGAEERQNACLEKLESRAWWETIRLWAALVGGQHPGKVAPILDLLLESETGLCLAGTMLADGVGDDEAMRQWLKLYLATIRDHSPQDHLQVRSAWSSSQQEKRRASIIANLSREGADRTWIEWLRYRAFAKSIAIASQMDLPRQGSNARYLIDASYGILEKPQQIALGRILCSGSPFWPGDPRELALLQVWTGPRRLVGHRLQVLASLGATRHDLARALRLDRIPPDNEVRLKRAMMESERSALAIWLGIRMRLRIYPDNQLQFLSLKQSSWPRSAANDFFDHVCKAHDFDFKSVWAELGGSRMSLRVTVKRAGEFLISRSLPSHARLLRELNELNQSLLQGQQLFELDLKHTLDFCEQLEPTPAEILFEWLRIHRKPLIESNFANQLYSLCFELANDLPVPAYEALRKDNTEGQAITISQLEKLTISKLKKLKISPLKNIASSKPKKVTDSQLENGDIAWDWACEYTRGLLVGKRDSWDLSEWNTAFANGKALSFRYRGTEWARECAAHWLGSLTEGTKAPKLTPTSPPSNLAELYETLGCMGLGSAATRALFAHCEPTRAPGITRLISLACRISLHPQQRPGELKRALAAYPADDDPIWSALAKHVARWSTQYDKDLLIDLAQHPEKREGKLEWGLRYIVRGDVALEDGTEATLDEIAEEAGVEPLPFLVDSANDLLWRYGSWQVD